MGMWAGCLGHLPRAAKGGQGRGGNAPPSTGSTEYGSTGKITAGLFANYLHTIMPRRSRAPARWERDRQCASVRKFGRKQRNSSNFASLARDLSGIASAQVQDLGFSSTVRV